MIQDVAELSKRCRMSAPHGLISGVLQGGPLVLHNRCCLSPMRMLRHTAVCVVAPFEDA